MSATAKIWCDEDQHKHYELFSDFNEWLDSDNASDLRKAHHLQDLPQPSKALFAGDRSAYDQFFREYREGRHYEALGWEFLAEISSDFHWIERNESRFSQLVERAEAGDVVPFIGAGISVAGGFPTWSEHLLQQARTAGLEDSEIQLLLDRGEYESIIDLVETRHGRDVFVGEIRDVFYKTGKLTAVPLIVSELFRDTLITTNYDRLIEQAFDNGEKGIYQVTDGVSALDSLDGEKVSIIKLHGNIAEPQNCILSKAQYDSAYGANDTDMALPIPRLLDYFYRNSSLLFLGCSLGNDRTIQVIRKAKEAAGGTNLPQHFAIVQAPQEKAALVVRNAQLSKLGITAIWYQAGQYDTIESILRLLKSELNYRSIGELVL